MESKKVSIVVATFNNGQYIDELLNSIVNQTFSDFEVVVRDDVSSDNTLEIVKRYIEMDSRIRLVENDVPSGSAMGNFFSLLNEQLQGEYIMCADADDVWLDTKVEKTLEVMQKTEQEFGDKTPVLVHTDLSVVDENLNEIAASMFRFEKISAKRKSYNHYISQNNITGCTMMINRALLRFCVPKPRQAVMHDWWLALCAAQFGEIVFLDMPTILYRQHSNNQVGAYNANDLVKSAQKLSNKQRMNAVYLSMFRQAGEFAERFGYLMTEDDIKKAKRYAEMEHLGKFGRIVRIVTGGYYKNTLLRNIGQFIVI